MRKTIVEFLARDPIAALVVMTFFSDVGLFFRKYIYNPGSQYRPDKSLWVSDVS
jgi:hypothetical protein